ncbi:MAG: helix-turn-helix domain-containing protein [Thermoprotei archaeon]
MNPPCPWAIPVIKSRADVKIYSCIYPKDSMGAEALVEVKCDNMEDIIRQIHENPSVKNVELFRINENTLYGIIESKKCTCRIVGLLRYHILKARISNDGKLQITLVIDSKHPLKPLVEKLKKNNVNVMIKSLYAIEHKNNDGRITMKQKMIIKYALESGLFDYPRRISVNEIAQKLDLSPSTVSEIIRRGLKRILSDYYKNLVIEK